MSELINVGRTWLRRTFSWSNSRRAWINRFAGGMLLLGFLVLAWFGRHLPTAAFALCSVFLLATTAFFLRRGWIRLFGPILFYDLVTTARRKRYFVIRYLCLLTLVGLLFFVRWVVGLDWGNMSSVLEAQKTTQAYFLIFVIVESIFLICLTPAYVAGSIAQEKECQTLEFVLATDLENREIVSGKLISRTLNLLMVFMSGLPILGILQFTGGVDPVFIVTWALTTAVGLISLSCLCMLNSVLNRRPRDAIAVSYFCVFGYLIASGASWIFTTPAFAPASIPLATLEKWLYVGSTGNPIVMAFKASEDLDAGQMVDTILTKYVRDFAIFHLCLAVVSTAASILLLRKYALQPARVQGRKWYRIRWPRPRVFSPSLIWKEVFVEKGLHVNFVGRILFCLLLAIAGASLWYMFSVERRVLTPDILAGWVRFVGMLGACLLLLTVGARAATSMTNERDRATMDSLLTSPVSNEAILFSKWLGAVLSIRWGMLCLAMIYILGALGEVVAWKTVPLIIFAWIVYAGAIAILGLWCSVTCRTSASATIWTYMSTAGLAVGHWLDMLCMIPIFIAGQYDAMRYLIMMQAGFTPPFALAVSFFYETNHYGVTDAGSRSSSAADASDQLVYGLEGLGIWIVIAIVLWLLTVSRFHLQGGRAALPEATIPDPEWATDGGLAPATNG